MLSQRFDKRKESSAGQRRGRPKAKVYRKNVSFFLQPAVVDEFDQAYHQLNVKLIAGSSSKPIPTCAIISA